ncbi:MAG: protein adenylyltransferase SelO [Rubrivivax sp.]
MPDSSSPAHFGFAFDNTYARELPGLSVAWPPARVPAPRLLFLNAALAHELQLDAAVLAGPDGAELFSGNRVPAGAEPVAQAYAGHQFGGFSPQLGDGRAVLLGEVVDRHGRRRDVALKGSGRTPFSRGGDGKAAVGPMLREVLIGEALHALGVPSTRALAVAATGETVRRDRPLPGAVLTRVAASHIRVGTFQYVLARGELDRLRQLAEYTLARHDPELAALDDPEARWMGLLRAVATRQARLLAQWMNLGFIHGVMNTDNMALSGESIDFGPCAFMEAYDPAAVFSSIDHGGRYAFGNQPGIARWNLARLAETLLPLVADPDDEAAIARAVAGAHAALDVFDAEHERARREGQRQRLGLPPPRDETEAQTDAALADSFLALLQTHAVDHTLAWRHLADAAEGRPEPLQALFGEPQTLAPWMERWKARWTDGGVPADRAAAMRRVSPRVIPRNHRVEEALATASEHGDLVPFEQLLAALRRPFDDDPALAPYAEPAPPAVTACYQTFCGT